MRSPTPLLLPALLMLLVTPAAAQSARDVLDRMLTEHDRRAQGIEDYTVVQETMGQAVTLYFVKDASGPHPVFRTRTIVTGGVARNAEDGDRRTEEFWDALPELAERATLVGRETIDGHGIHVVRFDDLSGTSFGRNLAPGNADFTPRRATLYVDDGLWVPRRMSVEGSMKSQGRTADVTMVMDLQDIREVDGLLHPFHTLVRIDGLGQAIDPETRKQYEQMKKQLADMPPSQRQMAEQMMKGRMEQIERLMEGDGTMNVELRVQELRVNAGPPK